MIILKKSLNMVLKRLFVGLQVVKMDAIRVRSERFKIPFFYQKKSLKFQLMIERKKYE